ncbi:MAG: response regulator [Spirochaetes bacterium]|nr:response regulator [Spirochaetota bacterium]MBU0956206.1 response regulator [Spirochaetota bacterium]
MNILVVEDEAMTVMLMKLLLKQLGYTNVYAVASGEKALAFVDEWQPDLVFMDILLAGQLDGIQTTVELLKKLACHIVYTTGYDSPDIRARADSSGASAYLLKPVSRADLAAAITKLFGPTELPTDS